MDLLFIYYLLHTARGVNALREEVDEIGVGTQILQQLRIGGLQVFDLTEHDVDVGNGFDGHVERSTPGLVVLLLGALGLHVLDQVGQGNHGARHVFTAQLVQDDLIGCFVALLTQAQQDFRLDQRVVAVLQPGGKRLGNFITELGLASGVDVVQTVGTTHFFEVGVQAAEVFPGTRHGFHAAFRLRHMQQVAVVGDELDDVAVDVGARTGGPLDPGVGVGVQGVVREARNQSFVHGGNAVVQTVGVFAVGVDGRHDVHVGRQHDVLNTAVQYQLHQLTLGGRVSTVQFVDEQDDHTGGTYFQRQTQNVVDLFVDGVAVDADGFAHQVFTQVLGFGRLGDTAQLAFFQQGAEDDHGCNGGRAFFTTGGFVLGLHVAFDLFGQGRLADTGVTFEHGGNTGLEAGQSLGNSGGIGYFTHVVSFSFGMGLTTYR